MLPQIPYRRGYDESGLILSDVDDLPMWSRKTLAAAKPVNFFDEGGGPNEKTSLLTPNLIDQNKDYDVKIIEVNLMRTDKAPLEDTDLAIISKLQAGFYLQLYTNETKRSWAAPMHALLKAPMAVAAAGASAYNPAWIVNGRAVINMPDGEGLVIKGGTGFQCLLNSTQSALDLTGLDMSVVFWGKRYALIKAKV